MFGRGAEEAGIHFYRIKPVVRSVWPVFFRELTIVFIHLIGFLFLNLLYSNLFFIGCSKYRCCCSI